MDNITLQNFGPIKDASLCLGDLTILLGPQASGKSLLLQMFKLAKDREAIRNRLEKYGYVVKKNADNLLDRFLGYGLSSLWGVGTSLCVGNILLQSKNDILATGGGSTAEKVFYVPAQRILSVADGTPKNFMLFSENDPYILRAFSETLRLFVQSGMNGSSVVYPLPYRLKGAVRKSFDEAIFHGGKVQMKDVNGQRKLVMDVAGNQLPYMTWSAGQKEFLPLLLAFYCLSGPPQKVVNREQYQYVVIEEPEMGLHPQAILTIILQILEFVQSGYKLIVSTHSPILLEFVWAVNVLRELPECIRRESLYRLFNLLPSDPARAILDGVLSKEIKTYFFARGREGVSVSDISTLDVGSENPDVQEWGGLTQFSSRVSDVVSRALSEA